jgi:hypothetical protein
MSPAPAQAPALSSFCWRTWSSTITNCCGTAASTRARRDDRRLQQEEELGDQLLAARQIGDLGHLVGLDHLAVDHPAAQLEAGIVLGGLGQRLGQADRRRSG